MENFVPSVSDVFLKELSVEVDDDTKRKPACAGGWSGNVLFSRGVAPQVSSGLKGLTAVFGMGTGVSPSL